MLMTQRILVISDSHGRDANIRRVLKREGPFDRLCHLGDAQCTQEEMEKLAHCPVEMIAGNCDLFCDLPMARIISLGKYRALMAHGHQHFVSLGPELLKEDARKNGCDIVLYGHTHVPMDDITDPDVWVFNPGSISLPRQKGGEPSYMVIEVKEDGSIREEVRFLQKAQKTVRIQGLWDDIFGK